jgi:NAD(P)-dependent dehydrogenase (short-subunit alcohol dehydrogenase family)
MMKRRYGRIINIASTAALKGYPYASTYCAAKHAILGLTRALALELATSGVTVNAICPGYTETSMLSNAIQTAASTTGKSEDEIRTAFVKVNPMQRFVSVDEVAEAVAWICLPITGAITGQSIVIAGGEVM